MRMSSEPFLSWTKRKNWQQNSDFTSRDISNIINHIQSKTNNQKIIYENHLVIYFREICFGYEGNWISQVKAFQFNGAYVTCADRR